MMICSYATPEYLPALERLRKSCEKFKLEYDFAIRPSKGAWLLNVSWKPHLIRAAAKRYCNMMWLDADAEIVGDPRPLWEEHFDICCNSRDRRAGENGSVQGAYRTGTLLLKCSEAVHTMLLLWEAMQPTLEYGQEPLLYDAHRDTPGVLHLELPPEYLCVHGVKKWWFPNRDGAWVDMPKDAIIAHHRTKVLRRNQIHPDETQQGRTVGRIKNRGVKHDE